MEKQHILVVELTNWQTSMHYWHTESMY